MRRRLEVHGHRLAPPREPRRVVGLLERVLPVEARVVHEDRRGRRGRRRPRGRAGASRPPTRRPPGRGAAPRWPAAAIDAATARADRGTFRSGARRARSRPRAAARSRRRCRARRRSRGRRGPRGPRRRRVTSARPRGACGRARARRRRRRTLRAGGSAPVAPPTDVANARMSFRATFRMSVAPAYTTSRGPGVASCFDRAAARSATFSPTRPVIACAMSRESREDTRPRFDAVRLPWSGISPDW